MFDYFIAFGVAFIGLLVVYYMFQAINKSEVVAIGPVSVSKPRARKTPKAPRHSKEIELDRVTEKLIAREVARNAVSMRPDASIVKAAAQEAALKNADTKRKNASARVVPAEVAEQQVLKDKGRGFQQVSGAKPKQRKRSSSQGQPQMTPEEEMDRKLGQFFRSHRRDKKSLKVSLKDDQPSGNGVQVIVTKDISNARQW